MKKLFVTLTLMVFTAIVGFSQAAVANAAAAEKKPQTFQLNKKTMAELGVTADVQTKILDIKKASDVLVKNIKEDTAMSEDDRKKALKELYAKRNKEMESLLTPEQKAKADEMKKALKEQAKNQ
jgi:hypothetical protein